MPNFANKVRVNYCAILQQFLIENLYDEEEILVSAYPVSHVVERFPPIRTSQPSQLLTNFYLHLTSADPSPRIISLL